MKPGKKELRKNIRLKINQLSEKEKFAQSETVLRKIENLSEFQSAHTVLLYWSLPTEVDTHAFVEKWSKNKKILLPVVVGDDLILKEYTDYSCLKVGKYGINEPVGTEVSDFSDINLCIVPGLAFDKSGNRLGRGKGYYDKLLGNINAKKIGVCFDIQLLDEIPSDSWDKKMDLICVPSIYFSIL